MVRMSGSGRLPISKLAWAGMGTAVALLLLGGPEVRYRPVLAAKIPGRESAAIKKVSRKANLKPSWAGAGKSLAKQDPNASFLSRLDLKSTAAFNPDKLLPSNRALELRQEYDLLTRDYESRRQASLVDPAEEQQHVERMKSFSRSVFANMRQHQVKQKTRKIKENLSGNSDLKKPVAVAAAITAMSTGTPIQASLSDETSITASTNIPYNATYLKLHSPLLEGTVSVAGNASSRASMLAPPPPDWLNRNERYFLGVSRQVGFWGLGSGLSYGGTSSNLNASLSRPITPELKAELGHTQALASGSSEETIKVNYELRF